MSRAFYKFNSVPKLIARFSHEQKSVAVWTTTCIVNNFGKNQDQTSCDVLINPSNPELSGVSNFPYFPRLSVMLTQYYLHNLSCLSFCTHNFASTPLAIHLEGGLYPR